MLGPAGGIGDIDDREIEGPGGAGLQKVETVRNVKQESGVIEGRREGREVFPACADNRIVEFNDDDLLDPLVTQEFSKGAAVAAPDNQGSPRVGRVCMGTWTIISW